MASGALICLALLVGCARVEVNLGRLDGDDAGLIVALDSGAPALDAAAVHDAQVDAAPDASIDSDGDGVPDALDLCPFDASKRAPGPCGCNVSAPAGLSLYFPFDEASGSSARDLVAGQLGSLRNFEGDPWSVGQVGNALAFDGVDDGVDVTGTRELRGLAFWLKPDALAPVRTETAWLSASSTNAGGEWMQPTNVYVSDDQYSNGGIANGAAQDFGGFGIALPAGAGILGIEAQVEMRSINPTGTFAIELSWNGGSSHTTSGRSAQPSPTVDTYIPFGGAADLWGRSWTAEQLGDENFRVQLIKAGINFSPMAPGVDHLRLRVSHTGVAEERTLLALNAQARVGLSATTVVTSGFPMGTVVFVDGVANGPLDTGWHHVVVSTQGNVTASQLQLGGGNSVAGRLDELKLFSVAPSAADLSTLRNVPACR